MGKRIPQNTSSKLQSFVGFNLQGANTRLAVYISNCNINIIIQLHSDKNTHIRLAHLYRLKSCYGDPILCTRSFLIICCLHSRFHFQKSLSAQYIHHWLIPIYKKKVCYLAVAFVTFYFGVAEWCLFNDKKFNIKLPYVIIEGLDIYCDQKVKLFLPHIQLLNIFIVSQNNIRLLILSLCSFA